MRDKMISEIIIKLLQMLVEFLGGIKKKSENAKLLREEGTTNINVSKKGEITKVLSPIEQVALDLEVDEKLVQAFIFVESGRYHRYQGRLVINYEAHYFKRFSGMVVPDRNEIKGDGLNQKDEWRNFMEAMNKDKEAACKSISMGKTQIMGANHKILGYNSAMEMFDAFDKSEDNAIYGFGSFVKADKKLLKACRTNDFRVMARRYNGPAYAKYKYHIKIENAYNKLKSAKS